jgi:hypothetical protein
MAKTLTPANFPHAAGLVRCRWAPVYLSPILGSPERFIIAVAVVGADGFHVEAANALKRLECLYGRAAETAIFAADVALEELRGVLAADGLSALKEGVLVFSGVSIGEVSEGEARTLRDLGRTWMSALSSLYRYTPESSHDELAAGQDGSTGSADRLPVLVLDHVVAVAPGLRDCFHEDVRQHRQRRASLGIAGISIDFSGPHLVANFATLQLSTPAQAVDRIKRKMFDLKVRRDEEKNELFSLRQHEMILFTPARDSSPLLNEKQVERHDEVLRDLKDQSDREGFGFLALNGVPAIGQRVVSLESVN